MKRLTIACMLTLMLSWLFTGCVRLPNGAAPVQNFDADRYLGRWYEIARLNHSFERGLSQVTAEYSKRDDGGIRVVNGGYSETKEKWKSIEGKAYFARKPGEGFLKVSFFGPFYGSYIILDLDTNYQHALVCGPTKSYLWILARTPQIDTEVERQLIARAAALGFDTTELILVSHPPAQ
jgi:apolipoprotein D and lipocalin family protein